MTFGEVYKITSEQTDKVYIGSTKQGLEIRMKGHHASYKRYNEGKSKNYTSSFELLKYDDAKIESIYIFDRRVHPSAIFMKEAEYIKKYIDKAVNIVGGRK